MAKITTVQTCKGEITLESVGSYGTAAYRITFPDNTWTIYSAKLLTAKNWAVRQICPACLEVLVFAPKIPNVTCETDFSDLEEDYEILYADEVMGVTA